jgi:hypothetical protein
MYQLRSLRPEEEIDMSPCGWPKHYSVLNRVKRHSTLVAPLIVITLIVR